MSIKSYIIGLLGNEEATVELRNRKGFTGITAFTEDLIKREFFIRPLLNPNFGEQMAQNVTFSGDPELINDGDDNPGWSPVANAGTWNFEDETDPFSGTKHISVTAADNLDNASFFDATSTDMSDFVAITGAVQLVVYDQTRHNIIFTAMNNGVLVGNSVFLNDFIDTATLGSYQKFSIPKDLMGLNGFVIDELTITITRTGGTKPTIYFDVLQIEQLGSPAVFRLDPDEGKKILLEKTILGFVDDIDLVLLNGTVTGLSYNKIMGVDALTNGILITTTIGGETFFSTSSRSMGDFIKGGGVVSSPISDGTNSCVAIEIRFAEPIVLDSKTNDSVTFTIQDDLSGLISFTTLAVGRTEDS